MFDLTSSKLLLLGIVALIVIGPKDLPVLLRTIGKYVGIIKRQAAEFRSQFEEAVRESELDQLKKDVESMGAEAEASLREAERTVTTELDAAKAEVESATDTALLEKPADKAMDLQSYDADGVPIVSGEAKVASERSSATSLERSSASTLTSIEHQAEAEPKPEPAAEDGRVAQKAGA